MSSTLRLHFEGAFGDRLAARVEMPVGRPTACALFAHCFTCGKDLKAVVRISRALAERGIAVFRFDFTGLGESAGDFADTNFSSNLEDLVAAAELMRGEWGGAQILIGHSLGGAAVLAAARRIPEVKAVATLGAPSDTEHLRDTLVGIAPELESTGEAEVNLGGRPVRVRHQLLADLEEQSMMASIHNLELPLLIFHSPVDEVVGIDHARRIYQAARHPKSFVSLDGADHLLLAREEDSRFVADVLAAWAARYVPMKGLPEPLPQGEVLVQGGAAGYANIVQAGAHTLRADEPVSVGGADSGPNPYDLLLAGLGACKSMTMRMYADRKGWPLEATRVRLRHTRIHAEDCEECETEKGRIDRIAVEVGVDGELDEGQRQRLLEISERCPVHRTLKSEIDIRSRGEAG
ncbi:MAG: alpha/beta fold hydrolase [Thermoanaerobaculia bacterium]